MAIQISGNTIIDDSQNITSTGNATFGGNVQLGLNPDAGADEGILLRKNGRIQLASNQGSTPVWSGYTVGTSTATSVVNADGSSTFANTVTSGSATRRGQFLGTCPSSVTASSADAFVASYDGNIVATVNYDGSATFASEIKVEGSYTPSGLYSGISRYGSLLIGTSSEAVGDARLAIDSSNGNITSDGSATFAGSLEALMLTSNPNGGGVVASRVVGGTAAVFRGGGSSFDLGNESTWTTYIDAVGRAKFDNYVTSNEGFYVSQTAGPSGDSIFKSWLGSDTYVDILDNGSATFAGQITTGDSSGATSGVNVGNQGYISISHNTRVSQNCFSIYDGQSSNSTVVNFNGDGTATFASEVVAGVRDSQGVFMTSGGSLEGFVSGNRVYNLGSDGSAEFGGTIQTKSPDGGFNLSLNAENNGNINLISDGTSDSNINIKPDNNLAATFSADGNASFAGQLTIGTPTAPPTNYAGVFFSNGNNQQTYTTIYARNLNSTGRVWAGANNAGAHTSTIFGDGSASFVGNITAGNVSDIKFKENIESAPSQLADISAFELKTFDWKDEAPLSDELKAQRKLGLIAQEAEVICPEMVYEVAGQGDDSYKAINHDVLIMKLLGAVKELSAKVAALEAN